MSFMIERECEGEISWPELQRLAKLRWSEIMDLIRSETGGRRRCRAQAYTLFRQAGEQVQLQTKSKIRPWSQNICSWTELAVALQGCLPTGGWRTREKKPH